MDDDSAPDEGNEAADRTAEEFSARDEEATGSTDAEVPWVGEEDASSDASAGQDGAAGACPGSECDGDEGATGTADEPGDDVPDSFEELRLKFYAYLLDTFGTEEFSSKRLDQYHRQVDEYDALAQKFDGLKEGERLEASKELLNAAKSMRILALGLSKAMGWMAKRGRTDEERAFLEGESEAWQQEVASCDAAVTSSREAYLREDDLRRIADEKERWSEEDARHDKVARSAKKLEKGEERVARRVNGRNAERAQNKMSWLLTKARAELWARVKPYKASCLARQAKAELFSSKLSEFASGRDGEGAGYWNARADAYSQLASEWGKAASDWDEDIAFFKGHIDELKGACGMLDQYNESQRKVRQQRRSFIMGAMILGMTSGAAGGSSTRGSSYSGGTYVPPASSSFSSSSDTYQRYQQEQQRYWHQQRAAECAPGSLDQQYHQARAKYK